MPASSILHVATDTTTIQRSGMMVHGAFAQ